MDFFEQWFHIDPDHGNGSVEALMIVLVIALVLFVLFRHQLAGLLRRSPEQPRPPQTPRDGA